MPRAVQHVSAGDGSKDKRKGTCALWLCRAFFVHRSCILKNSYFSARAEKRSARLYKVVRKARDLRVDPASAERSNRMNDAGSKGDGKRASEAMRTQGGANPDALAQALASYDHSSGEPKSSQQIAAVTGTLSSTDSTPAGTPHAKKANHAASPMQHMGAEKSIVQTQHDMLGSMQNAQPTVWSAAENRAEEMRANMENDKESTRSVRCSHTRHNCTLPHASNAAWYMYVHIILLCII